MKLSNFLLILLLLLKSINIHSGEVNGCSDILKLPPTDFVDSSQSSIHEIAFYSEFCRIASSYTLDSTSYENFSRDYAKRISSSSGSAHAKYLKVISGGASGSNNVTNENEAMKFLSDNKTNIQKFYENNCGKRSYEEFLQYEAISKQKIVHQGVVQAWKECVTNSGKGLSAFIFGENTDLDFHQVSVVLSWKTNVNVGLQSVILNYAKGSIESLDEIDPRSAAPIFPEKNLSEVSYLFHILNKNIENFITFNAKTETGELKTVTVKIPRKIPDIIWPEEECRGCCTPGVNCPIPLDEKAGKLKDFHYYLDVLLEGNWITPGSYIIFKEDNDVPFFGENKEKVFAVNLREVSSEELLSFIRRFSSTYKR